VALRHAADPEDALAKAFALGSPADIDTVWVDGRPCRTRCPVDGFSADEPGHVTSTIPAEPTEVRSYEVRSRGGRGG
ncbi:MAG TPA: hypothetical protein VEZ18_16940, partial [Geodermatophilus sp.]|nr:hypothetical protein [Geodermatophilus sp.]